MKVMKSYGCVDSSWDEAKARSMFEDALDMAAKHNIPVYVGEDAGGSVVTFSNRRGIHMLYEVTYPCQSGTN